MRLLRMSVCMGMVAAALQAAAIDCGTLASPAACSVQVGGQVEYVFSNFTLVNSAGYVAADVGISVGTDGGLTARVEFTKTGPTAGSAFFADTGESQGITFGYDVQVNALQPGTAALAAPLGVVLEVWDGNGTGRSQAQLTLNRDNVATSLCLAVAQGGAVQPGKCELPAGTADDLRASSILTLFGGTAGNASVETFAHLYSATFTPAGTGGDGENGGGDTGAVPEPSTWALMGAGLGLLGWRGARRQKR